MTASQQLTRQQLTVMGEVIMSWVFTPAMIREMATMPGGAEQLRLIVKDDLGGAADKIADAFWEVM